jgi:tetratricopeptide (TPR) repeat protein
MKYLFALLMFVFVSGKLSAQKEEFDDLLILYVDEKYDKLISKAEGYAESDKYRKNPEPLLYLAKAYYEMSLKEEYAADYPKAFRTSLKYAAKYRKKDKDLTLWSENENFFAALRKASMEEGELYLSEQDYSKASRVYKGIIDFDPDDVGSQFLYGYTLFKLNRQGEADVAIKEGAKALSKADIGDLDEAQKELLKNGLIYYSEYLHQNGRADSARVTMKIGQPYFKEDNEFRLTYEDVHK